MERHLGSKMVIIRGKPLTAYFNRFSTTSKGKELWRLRIRVDVTIVEQIDVHIDDYVEFSFSPHVQYKWAIAKSKEETAFQI